MPRNDADRPLLILVKSSPYLLLTGVVFAIGLCVFSFVFFAQDQPVVSDLGLDKAAWEVYAEHHSSDEMRTVLLAEGANLSYDDSHALAHIVGEVLYEKNGPLGIAACGTEFAYGCYHGFAGRALEEKGMDSISTVNESCLTSIDELGCQHGIGHGILAFLGNDQLLQALKACESLHQSSPVGGCFGGVFMEYNFNTMQSPSGIEVRPFMNVPAYEPCVSLPSDLQSACYFDQPAWWHASALPNASEKERFARDGELCSFVRDTENKETCYRGIGNVVAPTSGFSEPLMHEWCGMMPGRSAETLCLEYALRHDGNL